MGYWIIRTIFQIMAFIPLGVGRSLGKMLGVLISMLPLARLRVSVDNIRTTLGRAMTDSEIIKLNHGIYKHFGQTLFELAHIFRINNKNLDKYVVFEGLENLDRLLQREEASSSCRHTLETGR